MDSNDEIYYDLLASFISLSLDLADKIESRTITESDLSSYSDFCREWLMLGGVGDTVSAKTAGFLVVGHIHALARDEKEPHYSRIVDLWKKLKFCNAVTAESMAVSAWNASVAVPVSAGGIILQ